MSEDHPPPGSTNIKELNEEQLRRKLEETEQQLKRFEQERKQEKQAVQQKQQSLVNTVIVDSQSYTVNKIKSIMRKYSPDLENRLRKSINNFRFLQDGHIFFTKNWLKNDDKILSTPLLFRPIYNTILHPVLNYILKHFATKQKPPHPGAAIFISGDQGIGKTSLMLILMSALTKFSIKYLYQKGSGERYLTDFSHMIGEGEDMTFSSHTSQVSESGVLVRIFDDCLPTSKDLKQETLSIIFTSPDPDRLNLKPRSPLIRHVFRLPTFSLAEDAVAMVGCTPTVPFSVLSPEDMELRTEEQIILYDIEKHKEERARNLPFESETPIISPEQETARRFLKESVDKTVQGSNPWNHFRNTILRHLYTTSTLGKNQKPVLKAFLSQVTDEYTWETIVAPLKTAIKFFSQMENNTVSIVKHLRECPALQTSIDPFFLTLYSAVLDSRGQTEEERFRLVIDRWISLFSLNPPKHDRQATIVKEALIQLMLSVWNRAENSPTTTSEQAKTDALFDFILTQIKAPHDSSSSLDAISNSITETILSDQPSASDPPQSENSLTSQLKSLKERIKEPNKPDVDAREKLQKKVEKIKEERGRATESALRYHLLDTLIDILLFPPYESNQAVLQSLFTLPTDEERDADIALRDNLMSLLTKPREAKNPADELLSFVAELILYLRFAEEARSSASTTVSIVNLQNGKMAQIVSDILIRIVDLQHESVEKRLQTLKQEISDAHDRLSLVLLMDRHFVIARNMNILVSPHSILKGLSERPEQPPHSILEGLSERPEQPPPGLNIEREHVFRRNLRDAGLSKWLAKATKTLFPLVNTAENDPENDDGSSRVLDTLELSILTNVNGVITKFFAAHENGHNPVDNPKWLAILRSMMNTILFLIDSGTPRGSILNDCEGLEKLLQTVFNAHRTHLTRVADYPMNGRVRDYDSDYVNDLTIFSTHFRTLRDEADDEQDDEETHPDFDVDSLRTLRLPRTLQMNAESQNRLERMSIALFARNLHWFLKAPYLPFNAQNPVDQFFTDFLQDLNPDDVVHRSFVDFMNATDLLSQQNFGLDPQEISPLLSRRYFPKMDETFTAQTTEESQSVSSTMTGCPSPSSSTLLRGDESSDDRDCSGREKSSMPFHLTSTNNLPSLLPPSPPQFVFPPQLPSTLSTTLSSPTITLPSQTGPKLDQRSDDQTIPEEEDVVKTVPDTTQQFHPTPNAESATTLMVEAQPCTPRRNRQPRRTNAKDNSSTPPNPLSLSRVRNGEEIDKQQPFQPLLTSESGVLLLLWASSELLRNAAEKAASPETGTKKAVSCLNVARASIFGPSPRWLTSTDVRTNRGLSFLWEGVLNSEKTNELSKVAESNHSRIMSFNTDHVFFENTLDAAWDDIAGLVPVLRKYKTKEERPAKTTSTFSLMIRSNSTKLQETEHQNPNLRPPISFVAVSPFVEMIVQSEVISAFAKLMTQSKYTEFYNAQSSVTRQKMPKFVEEPLVCISFLLNIPTQIRFNTTTTFFHNERVRSNNQTHFSSYTPVFETKKTLITTIPMLTFPNISNKSVDGTEFPQIITETKRGETDFYAEDLQEVDRQNLPGIDSLIVSRGRDVTHETIFMPIQATCSIKHSLVETGILLMQQLLFQTMRHLEPSEGVVALYNYATTQIDPIFPPQTGILGFHMVSSLLQFGNIIQTHISSILRHRDYPLVATSPEPPPTMTTRDITEKLLGDLPQYPTFSTKYDPWTTSLSSAINPKDPVLTLPFRWFIFYNKFRKTPTDGRKVNDKDNAVAEDEETSKDWLDRMIRRTMLELNRIGVSPDDLDEGETEGIHPFSSFVLCTAISCRRNEIIDPDPTSTTSADDARFVELVRSIVETDESEALQSLLASLSDQTPNSPPIDCDERLRHLDKLCRKTCIEARLHTVHDLISTFAMKRIRTPAQESLSVLQSKKDGGMFRVPDRNNLSAILHCGTILLDNIPPLPDITPPLTNIIPPLPDIIPPLTNVIPTSTVKQDPQPSFSPPVVPTTPSDKDSSSPQHSPTLSKPLASRSVPISRTPDKDSSSHKSSPTTSASPPRSKTLRIPLHSFILAKYGFSDLIPALFELDEKKLNEEVTDVVPAPLNQWHPRQVVIDPSLLPRIDGQDPLSLFTTFIHRLFDNPFIPVTTSLSTAIPNFLHDDEFILSQIRKITGILRSITLKKHAKLQTLLSQLSAIEQSEQASTVFSLLPTIKSSLRRESLQSELSSHDATSLTSEQMTELLTAIESIEKVPQQPTLVFVKPGNGLFHSPNTLPTEVVDTETECRPFPIPFSTGYKEMDLREEMKDVFEPLTRLLPQRFPTGRPPLISFESNGIKEGIKTPSSTKEAEDRARESVDSAILRMGEASRTPLFVFVVDEHLADLSSLPMSLRSSNSSIGCGMMRQRSLADVLWILFLTRISREVMALPLNTSIDFADFSTSVIPFFTIAFRDAKESLDEFFKLNANPSPPNKAGETPAINSPNPHKLSPQTHTSSPAKPTQDLSPELEQVVSSTPTQSRSPDRFTSLLIAQSTTELAPEVQAADHTPALCLELLVSAYPLVKDQTQILPLTHLLMLSPSRQDDESRLDLLIHHPSPEIEIVTLIHYFELLCSKTQDSTLEDAIRNHGFTPAKVSSNMLHALYLIIEHTPEKDIILKRKDQPSLVTQLFKTIKTILHMAEYTFFEAANKETLRTLKSRIQVLTPQQKGFGRDVHSRVEILASIGAQIDWCLSQISTPSEQLSSA